MLHIFSDAIQGGCGAPISVIPVKSRSHILNLTNLDKY